ncbi:MAG TPA: exodeoxyribonuclease VII small subunit [Syntrophales bacterium]|nr:exodeoxyribonuclease VII small subunit [Syntrophales bacterium]HPQ43165.1 exodeoxyribonuclease VII small subunit [Syntrophales bacterium]
MTEKKFEKALEKLEGIVRKMEEGNMSLEESLKAFEEGIKLSRFCTEKLDEAEKRVKLLLREGDALTVKPFGEKDEDREEPNTFS